MNIITEIYDSYVIARNRRDCYNRNGYKDAANICQKEMNFILKKIEKHNKKINQIGGFLIKIDMSRHNIE